MHGDPSLLARAATALTLATLLLGGTASATAMAASRGEYNCKPDRVLDAPAQISSVEVQSAARIRIVATPGTDKSGYTELKQYRITSAAGVVSTVPPAGTLYIDNANKLLDVVVEGLDLSGEYRVTAVSADRCGNEGLSRQVTVGGVAAALAADTTGPSVTAPAVAWYWGGLYVPAVHVQVSDDTALSRIQFFVGDHMVVDLDLSGVHWWATADGPSAYKWFISTQFRGTTQTVKVVAFDLHGNSTSVQSTLPLP